MRVWDSPAEVRYLVLPERPPSTEAMTEDQLAALVTRDLDDWRGPGGRAMNGIHDLGGMPPDLVQSFPNRTSPSRTRRGRHEDMRPRPDSRSSRVAP